MCMSQVCFDERSTGIFSRLSRASDSDWCPVASRHTACRHCLGMTLFTQSWRGWMGEVGARQPLATRYGEYSIIDPCPQCGRPDDHECTRRMDVHRCRIALIVPLATTVSLSPSHLALFSNSAEPCAGTADAPASLSTAAWARRKLQASVAVQEPPSEAALTNHGPFAPSPVPMPLRTGHRPSQGR